MSPDPHIAHLRTLRRKNGLSEKDIAQILGFRSKAQISRHERYDTMPDLLTALGYEAIFHVSISEMFPELYKAVEARIEERLGKMETELQQSTAKGREGILTAQRLEFLWERRHPQINMQAS
jgi:transcriptional regulator with XRE-family HTH domain